MLLSTCAVSDSPILTTVVGSYPVPAWLASQPSTPNLRDAVLAVLKTQELAGLDVISDGELSRFDVNHPETNGMIEYFVRPLAGVRTAISRDDIAAFRARQRLAYRTRPAAVVTGRIGEGTLNLPAAWAAVNGLTTRPLKFTVTSPYMLAHTLLDEHYRDPRALAMELAEVLRRQVSEIEAAVIQVDEAHLTGHAEDAAWAHESINHVLGGARGKKAVHLCFGNYAGQTVQRGEWATLIGFLNRIAADHLLLEFARRGYDELELFRELRPGLALGVGVIDIKDNGVESAEEVAQRIEHAVKVLGAGRIGWVHPDCGFWMLPRGVADRKMAALVQGRDLFLGKA
jgi:5-methyltetrahydropteroyltriglutamate--homocysteine methyltransferase